MLEKIKYAILFVLSFVYFGLFYELVYHNTKLFIHFFRNKINH